MSERRPRTRANTEEVLKALNERGDGTRVSSKKIPKPKSSKKLFSTERPLRKEDSSFEGFNPEQKQVLNVAAKESFARQSMSIHSLEESIAFRQKALEKLPKNSKARPRIAEDLLHFRAKLEAVVGSPKQEVAEPVLQISKKIKKTPLKHLQEKFSKESIDAIAHELKKRFATPEALPRPKNAMPVPPIDPVLWQVLKSGKGNDVEFRSPEEPLHIGMMENARRLAPPQEAPKKRWLEVAKEEFPKLIYGQILYPLRSMRQDMSRLKEKILPESISEVSSIDWSRGMQRVVGETLAQSETKAASGVVELPASREDMNHEAPRKLSAAPEQLIESADEKELRESLDAVAHGKSTFEDFKPILDKAESEGGGAISLEWLGKIGMVAASRLSNKDFNKFKEHVVPKYELNLEDIKEVSPELDFLRIPPRSEAGGIQKLAQIPGQEIFSAQQVAPETNTVAGEAGPASAVAAATPEISEKPAEATVSAPEQAPVVSERVQDIRQRIEALNDEAAGHTSGRARTGEEIQVEALALETELKNLERTEKTAESKPAPEEAAQVTSGELFSSDVQKERLPKMVADIPENGRERWGSMWEPVTAAEWRAKLRGLIEGTKERFGMNERGKGLKEHLEKRSEVLQEKTKGFGPKMVEYLGSKIEQYNKLNWKTKLAVTAALMTGVALSGGAAAIGFTSALWLQRGIGAIGAGINSRKALDARLEANPNAWYARMMKTEVARNTWAAVYTATYMGATTFAVHEGIEGIKAVANSDLLPHGAEWVKTTAQDGIEKWRGNPDSWLGKMFGHQISPPSSQVVENLVPTPEMPSVEAAPGHGYEYMMKRMWEQLHSQNIDASKFETNSDMHKLLTADANSIDKVVHQIAADPNHGFFNPDGTSVRIEPGTHMTIGADHQIHISGQGMESVMKAAEHASTTPAYHPETLHVKSPDVYTGPVSSLESISKEDVEMVQDLYTKYVASGNESPEVRSALDEQIKNLTSEQRRVFDTYGVEDVRRNINYSLQDAFSGKGPLVHGSEQAPTIFGYDPIDGHPMTELEAQRLSELQTSMHHAGESRTEEEGVFKKVSDWFNGGSDKAPESVASGVPADGEHLVINQHGIEIPTTVPNIYADAEGHLSIYGGSLTERIDLVQKFLTENPDKIIFGTDDNGNYRIPWHLYEGQAIPAEPVRTGGFLGFGSSFMDAPKPDEFVKIIK
ncbi:MAG: hypothetical protein NT108_01775 [Candidatus Kaiserbacteria bacterium]|nr:hypothetical protein [Candidatus Kaiserbacteria bacterium]